MKAVRYHGPKQPFRLEYVPAPEPGAGEVRVRIRAAGMCHTELHFESGLLNLGVAPLTMGHEIAGVIEVLPDGSITFPLAGRVEVAGLSTPEAEKRIAAKLKEYLPDPIVSVVITLGHPTARRSGSTGSYEEVTCP